MFAVRLYLSMLARVSSMQFGVNPSIVLENYSGRFPPSIEPADVLELRGVPLIDAHVVTLDWYESRMQKP